MFFVCLFSHPNIHFCAPKLTCHSFVPSFPASSMKNSNEGGDGIIWRAQRWLKQQAYLSNSHKDIHIKAQIKTKAHSMDFYQSIFFLFFFSSFPRLSHSSFSRISRVLLGHDKSKRDVMTWDPLLALGGWRENEWVNGGGKMERKRWKRFVWKLLLTRHWFSALISQCAQIREMKKRKEEDGYFGWGGDTWQVSQCFFGQT